LKEISTIRKSGFWQQFNVLVYRIMTSFIRAPIFLWAVFGNAIVTTMLIATIYFNTGRYALNLDFENNKRGVTNWMGLSFFTSIDWFTVGMMSQVVSLPTRLKLYRKEKLSGMFSAHSYYLSLWMCMSLLLLQYPAISSFGSFYFLGLPDSSLSN
jgi:hypothetical protein